ncbi:DUF1178 family protein [Kiloniella laminariae]|uniref:DUF1178 family protein n=1 Tax=Kiloniella laminariae TaxID=454162 RepID=A0ABT4LM23_9PROT|nr:DUF1178 family protein [Kiloniella laminariae]MCZ4282159.1 DUF1178 family protein [Kiloniella laminariae]
MILFDLKCENNHVFEAWFKDSAAFRSQSDLGVISCPNCASTAVSKALMAPNVSLAKSEKKTKSYDDLAKVQKFLAQAQKVVEDNFDYVGKDFAKEARKIHYGESDKTNIYGEASEVDAKELKEEGVAFAQIPWKPKADA